MKSRKFNISKTPFVLGVEPVEMDGEVKLAVESIQPQEEWMPAPILFSAVEALEYSITRVGGVPATVDSDIEPHLRFAHDFLDYHWSDPNDGVLLKVELVDLRHLPTSLRYPPCLVDKTQIKRLEFFRRTARKKYATLAAQYGQKPVEIFSLQILGGGSFLATQRTCAYLDQKNLFYDVPLP